MKEPLKKAPQPPEKKIPHQPEKDGKEEAYDKTIADSFPASDPPSSIPDTDEDEDAA